MSRLTEPFLGRWWIDHMDGYDQDYLDLVKPAFIRFDRDGSGELDFGAVTGQLDCCYDKAGSGQDRTGQNTSADANHPGRFRRDYRRRRELSAR